ncbi:unnamed protein product, partial [Ixodes pacificus]
MEALYGPERFQKLWWDYCDFYKRLLHNQGGDVCRAELAKIRCPTLIVHGGKDPLVTPEHPAYLLRHIALSKRKAQSPLEVSGRLQQARDRLHPWLMCAFHCEASAVLLRITVFTRIMNALFFSEKLTHIW